MDQYSAPHLPRSVLLALWLGAGTGSERDLGAALRVVQGDDEPHQVTVHGDAGRDATDAPTDLSALVRSWVDGVGSPATVAALLPAPGDLAGTPSDVSTDAVAAGECLVVVTGPPAHQVASAAVPDVRRFGSVFEPGHEVTWHVRPVPPWSTRVLGAIGSVEEADHDLRTALTMAVRSLDALDVSHWRDDAADAIAALREPVNLAAVVPPALDPRRVRLLSQALRLGAIARLGREDDGAAVNVFQSDQRSAALAAVDRAARRAISAATLHLP